MRFGKSEDQPDGTASAGGSKLFALLFSFAILVGVALLVIGLTPTDLPSDRGSNFLDTVFHNKGVILAARLLLVAAAFVLAVGGTFIVSSIVMRMRNGEWLKRAGPFEIGGPELGALESRIDDLRAASSTSEEEVAELTGQIEVSAKLVRELRRKLSSYKKVTNE